MVDLYVHANPDLIPRHSDDLELSVVLKAAGFAKAVHRHHFTSTAERGRIAQEVTGFPLLGAVLLNESVGGLNPAAVHVALEMGAVWVGMATLSAAHYRSRPSTLLPDRRRAMTFDRGTERVLDDQGRLRPVVNEILDLVAARGAVLNYGYLGFEECVALQAAAVRHGVRKRVMSNPENVIGLTSTQVDALLQEPGTVLEVTAYSMYPDRLGGPQGSPDDRAALIRRVGVERCVLSSDGGNAGTPTPPELLRWAWAALEQRGFSAAELTALVRDNPARLLS